MSDAAHKAEPRVITIDGPVGSGKGTISSRLAHRLGWHYLDSGVLYRLVALKAINSGCDDQDHKVLARIAESLDCEFSFDGNHVSVLLDDLNVTGQLRTEPVSVKASKVAAVPAVREALVARQRGFLEPPGLIADGRDMGTVIFPDAPLKIFLTASVEARAQRRYKQLKDKGESVNLSRLFGDLEARDKRDSTREVAPLKPAEDAVLIDSTDLGIDAVIEKIESLAGEIF